METTHKSDLLSMVKENLFRTGEKKHLRAMKEHASIRDESAHADLLSKLQNSLEIRSRQELNEYNGIRYWTYYFENEQPHLDSALPAYLNEAWNSEENSHARVLEPPLTKLLPGESGKSIGDATTSWLRKFILGRMAYSQANYSAAEIDFRQALKETDDFEDNRSREKALSALGLAQALTQLDRGAEADQYYELALSIDEEMVGSGEASLEDEFYLIAKHFISQGKLEEMEDMLYDLWMRLQMSVGRNDPLTARCLNELGIIYLKLQEWHKAEVSFLKALEILLHLKPVSTYAVATVCGNLASLLDRTNRLDEADKFYRRALEYAKDHREE